MSLVEELIARVSALPGAERTRSTFGPGDRPAWSVSGQEFAHLHADDLLDLRLPRQVQLSLKGDARAHFRKSRSEWLEFEFHDMADVARLAHLARDAWAAARARASAHATRRVSPGA